MLILIASSWMCLFAMVENSKTNYGVFPSPQEAFQSGFSKLPPHLESIPITYAAPDGCDHVWFVLSQGYGIGGGSTFVETDEGWIRFPETLVPPQIICFGLNLFGLSPD